MRPLLRVCTSVRMSNRKLVSLGLCIMCVSEPPHFKEVSRTDIIDDLCSDTGYA